MSPRKPKTDEQTKFQRQTVARRGKARRISPFVRVYQLSPVDLIAAIRRGLPSKELVRTSQAMHLPNEHIYRMLRLPASTTKRKLSLGERFSPEQSERLLGLQRLIGQAEVMLSDSGENVEAFDAPGWVASWLEEASPALGNRKPGDFMDTVTGQGIVSNLLAKMQSGAYA